MTTNPLGTAVNDLIAARPVLTSGVFYAHASRPANMWDNADRINMYPSWAPTGMSSNR